MGLFSSKKKNHDRTDSWSLGRSNTKNSKDANQDLISDEPTNRLPPSASLESPASEVHAQPIIQQAPRPALASDISSRSFAAEVDGSMISSLPPSHRDGGSVIGSEPTRGPSTKATSLTSGQSVDLLEKEPHPPDSLEKEAMVVTRPSPGSTAAFANEIAEVGTDKEAYTSSPSASSRPVSYRQESSIFSVSMSVPSSMSQVYREYNFYNTPSFKDLVICDPSQKAMFYAEVASHTRSKSDVALREFHGETKISGSKSMKVNEEDVAKAQIVAAADYHPDAQAQQIKLAIGDPLNPAGCVWVMMMNVLRDAKSGIEKYDMIVPTADGNNLTFNGSRVPRAI